MSLWAAAEAVADVLERAVVEKLNSSGMVADRAIFFGGGSKRGGGKNRGEGGLNYNGPGPFGEHQWTHCQPEQP